MSKIVFPAKPIKLVVELSHFYDIAREDERTGVIQAYEGMHDAIKTAISISSELFTYSEFDVEYAMDSVKAICDELLYDTYILEHLLEADYIAPLLRGMEFLVKDIHVATLEYARYLHTQKHNHREIIEELMYPEWEIYPENSTNLDEAREICLIVDPPGD